MQRTILVAMTLTLLLGLALWQQHHLVVAQAATLYSTFTVTNTADSGVGSLRQAIADANLTLGTDTITFDTAVFATPKTITLTSGELAISDSVTITGPAASVLNISGNSSSRVFLIGSGNYDVTLLGLTVINGRHIAPGGGGGILNFSSGTLTLANSALSGNSANGSGGLHGSGGGIFNAGDGAVALINSALSDNSANGLASVDLAFGEGGGIFNAANGTVTLTNTTLSDNSANSSVLPGRGGGIFNASTGTVTLINTTLSDNAAIGSQGFGGGIANADGTLNLTNSTLSGNFGTGGGTGKGGGVYNTGNGTVTLTNSTLTGNFVSGAIQSEGGGIFSEGAGTVTAHNSLIASNSSTILAPDVRGTFNSQGHNLIGDGTGSSGFSGTGDQVGTSGSPINALLAPLGNNGGPTQTRALLPGSPAINTGDNCVIEDPGCLATPLSTDQRGAGFARNSGGAVDIGAFEMQHALIEYEADVAPRPFGNGALSLVDWVQVGRFAAALDVASAGSEFQRADCAPRDTRGNGVLSLADWVQAGRYGALLDPVTAAGGPTEPQSPGGSIVPATIILSAWAEIYRERLPEHVRHVSMTPISTKHGDLTIAVELRGRGDENAIAFSLEIPDSIQLMLATPESSDIMVAFNQNHAGRLGVMLAMPPEQAFRAGQVVRLSFVGMGQVTFADGPVLPEVVTVLAEPVPAVFSTPATRIDTPTKYDRRGKG